VGEAGQSSEDGEEDESADLLCVVVCAGLDVV